MVSKDSQNNNNSNSLKKNKNIINNNNNNNNNNNKHQQAFKECKPPLQEVLKLLWYRDWCWHDIFFIILGIN